MATDIARDTDTSPGTDSPIEHKRATVHPAKADAVAELAEAFRTSSAAVLTDYRGLTVKQLQELRRAMGSSTSYSVSKNTLTRLAAQAAGLTGLDELLTGPTAVAFVHGDPVEAAKGLRDFGRTNPALVVKGGVMDGRPVTADEVRRLADLESREVLLAKLAGAMKASLSQAVYLLNAPLAQAARVIGALQAKAEQDPSVLGGGAGSAPADETPTDTSADTDTPAEAPVVEAAAGDDTVASEALEPAETETETVTGADSQTETPPATDDQPETSNETSTTD